MIGRLVHHAEILGLKGDSYRLRDKDVATRPRPRDRRRGLTRAFGPTAGPRRLLRGASGPGGATGLAFQPVPAQVRHEAGGQRHHASPGAALGRAEPLVSDNAPSEPALRAHRLVGAGRGGRPRRVHGGDRRLRAPGPRPGERDRQRRVSYAPVLVSVRRRCRRRRPRSGRPSESRGVPPAQAEERGHPEAGTGRRRHRSPPPAPPGRARIPCSVASRRSGLTVAAGPVFRHPGRVGPEEDASAGRQPQADSRRPAPAGRGPGIAQGLERPAREVCAIVPAHEVETRSCRHAVGGDQPHRAR